MNGIPGVHPRILTLDFQCSLWRECIDDKMIVTVWTVLVTALLNLSPEEEEWGLGLTSRPNPWCLSETLFCIFCK